MVLLNMTLLPADSAKTFIGCAREDSEFALKDVQSRLLRAFL
jgi:hypothetical protein